MAIYTRECVAGHNYRFGIGVRNPADSTMLLANPTIDPVNDFLISLNGTGAWDTLDIAPVVSPAGAEGITCEFSAAETSAAVAAAGGDQAFIRFRWADAVGGQWVGSMIDIPVLPHATANANDVTGIMAALTVIDDFIDTEVAAIKAKTDALPADTAATLTTLQTKLRKYVQLLLRKDAQIATDNAAELTELNASGGAYSNATDSAEALRDRGDAAWLTATGFATPANVTAARDAVIADTGATETAILAALSALNDLSAEEVWSYVRRTLTGVPALLPPPIAGSTLNITQAATYGPHTITDLAIPSGWTSARLTMKREDRQSRPDSEAALQILVTNGGAVGDGLKVLNKAATGFEVSGASLAVSGDVVTITIADHITAQLDAVKHRYDIKFYHGDSLSSVVTAAICQVWATPTQTV